MIGRYSTPEEIQRNRGYENCKTDVVNLLEKEFKKQKTERIEIGREFVNKIKRL